MAKFCNGDSTTFNIPQTIGDIGTALNTSPPLADSSNTIATTAWVKGQGYGTGGGGGGPVFADAEIPTGNMDGVNNIFTLLATPNPTQSLQLFYNGGLQIGTYVLNTNTITLNFAPQLGDILVTYYRH